MTHEESRPIVNELLALLWKLIVDRNTTIDHRLKRMWTALRICANSTGSASLRHLDRLSPVARQIDVAKWERQYGLASVHVRMLAQFHKLDLRDATKLGKHYARLTYGLANDVPEFGSLMHRFRLLIEPT